MLVIRQEQMRAFEEASVERYIWELADELKAELPEQCAGRNMEMFIRYGADRAATYDVRSETAVARYVRLQLYLGRDFDREHEWASAVLSSSGFVNDAAKMTKLTLVAMEQQTSDEAFEC